MAPRKSSSASAATKPSNSKPSGAAGQRSSAVKADSSAIAASSTRSRRAGSAQPTSSMSGQENAPSYAKPTISTKAKQKPMTVNAEVVKDTRSMYGDNHAANEARMMAEHAKIAFSHGLIDEEMCAKWSSGWQMKGELELKWNDEILNRYRPDGFEPEEIMSLKRAQTIAKKKDDEEKKFLEEYFAGKIDENGKPIHEEMGEGEEKMEVVVEKPLIIKKGDEKKKDPIKKVASGKISKQAPAAKAPDLSMIMEEESSPARVLAPIPAPAPAKIPSKAIPASKPAAAPAPKQNASKKPIPLTPLPGRPDYKAYNYYQCVALCDERNLVSGGGVEMIRNRLIQDDINVIQGLPRDAKQYAKDKASRPRKTIPPKVLNAPQAPPAVYTGDKKAYKRGGSASASEMTGDAAGEARGPSAATARGKRGRRRGRSVSVSEMGEETGSEAGSASVADAGENKRRKRTRSMSEDPMRVQPARTKKQKTNA